MEDKFRDQTPIKDLQSRIRRAHRNYKNDYLTFNNLDTVSEKTLDLLYSMGVVRSIRRPPYRSVSE